MPSTLHMRGLVTIKHQLDILEAILSDDRLLEGIVGEWFRAHMRRRMDTGSYGGNPLPGYGSEPIWFSIREHILGAQLARRVLRWSPGRERLAPSLFEKNHPMHIMEVRGGRVRAGTRHPHADRLTRAGRNQFGERRPARQIISMTREQQKIPMRMLKAAQVDAARARGLPVRRSS